MNIAAAINPRSTDLNNVVVNGITSPGLAQLTGVKVPYKWDEQQQYGREGAVTRFIGRGAAKFTLTITLWEPEHFLAWPIFTRMLEPPSKLKPFFVQMAHPLLSAAGIKAVGVESLGQPERQPNGRWIATIQLIEYRPPKPALVTPKGSIPAVVNKAVSPQSEVDRQLVEWTEKYRKAQAGARLELGQ